MDRGMGSPGSSGMVHVLVSKSYHLPILFCFTSSNFASGVQLETALTTRHEAFTTLLFGNLRQN
jgi:hypothetical protein